MRALLARIRRLLTHARRFFAWAAAVTDAAALVAAFLPIAATRCGSVSQMSASSPGAAPAPVPPQPVPQVCTHTPLVGAFTSPLAAIAVLLILSALGLVPLLTLNGRRGWPAALAGVGLAAIFVVSFGATLYWLPMMLCTLAAAVSPAERPAPGAADGGKGQRP